MRIARCAQMFHPVDTLEEWLKYNPGRGLREYYEYRVGLLLRSGHDPATCSETSRSMLMLESLLGT